jgi:hypothetical protein
MKKVDAKISKTRVSRSLEERIARALANGALGLHPGVRNVYVKHSDNCRIYKGRRCNCNPSITSVDGDTVTEIDAKGHGEPRRKCLGRVLINAQPKC